MRFSQLVPWKHESVGRVLSGHQLGKPSDVRWIMSTHEGSFVFIIRQPKISFNYPMIAERSAMRYEVCDMDSNITWPYQIAGHPVGSHGCIIKLDVNPFMSDLYESL